MGELFEQSVAKGIDDGLPVEVIPVAGGIHGGLMSSYPSVKTPLVPP